LLSGKSNYFLKKQSPIRLLLPFGARERGLALYFYAIPRDELCQEKSLPLQAIGELQISRYAVSRLGVKSGKRQGGDNDKHYEKNNLYTLAEPVFIDLDRGNEKSAFAGLNRHPEISASSLILKLPLAVACFLLPSVPLTAFHFSPFTSVRYVL